MDYWTKRGFKLKGMGKGNPDTWIAYNDQKACVVKVDFWDNWNKESEWFSSVARAEHEARELVSA